MADTPAFGNPCLSLVYTLKLTSCGVLPVCNMHASSTIRSLCVTTKYLHCRSTLGLTYLPPLRLIDFTVPSSFTTPKPSSSSLAVCQQQVGVLTALEQRSGQK